MNFKIIPLTRLRFEKGEKLPNGSDINGPYESPKSTHFSVLGPLVGVDCGAFVLIVRHFFLDF